MRKILSLLLAAMMVLMMVPSFSLAAGEATATMESKTVEAGEEFEVIISLTNCDSVKSLKLSNFNFGDNITYVSGTSLIQNASMNNWNNSRLLVAFADNTNCNGQALKLVLKANEDATAGDVNITFDAEFKEYNAETLEDEAIASAVVPGVITIEAAPVISATATMESKTVEAGEEFEVIISLTNCDSVKSLKLSNFNFGDNITYVSGTSLIQNASMNNWNNSRLLVAFADNTNCNGQALKLVLKANEDATAGDVNITFDAEFKKYNAETLEDEAIASAVVPGVITIEAAPVISATATMESKTVEAGEEFEVIISLTNCDSVKSLKLSNFNFGDSITYVSGTSLIQNASMNNWNNSRLLVAFADNTNCNGQALKLVLKANEDATAGDVNITFDAEFKKYNAETLEDEAIASAVVPGVITIEEASSDVAVTGVTLDKTSGTLEIGGTETLVATVAPADATNKAVAWTTSDATVATVADGVVTAVAAGTATITVTTEDGGFTATYAVTVNPAVVAVTGVTLDKTSGTLEIGGTETLVATVAPADATNKAVAWTTSDATVATVADGVVTAVAAGTATITVTTEDGGFTATYAVTVNPDDENTGGSTTGGSTTGGSTTGGSTTGGSTTGGSTTGGSTTGGSTTGGSTTIEKPSNVQLAYTVSSTNAEVRVTADANNSPITSVTITVNGVTEVITEADENGVYSYLFTGLSRSTTYPVEVIVENGVGSVTATGEFTTTSGANHGGGGGATKLPVLSGGGKDDIDGPVVDPVDPVDPVNPVPGAGFVDVKNDAWYNDSVNYVVENGLMNGVGSNSFAPNDNLTRAMLVTVLYRAEGQPAVNRSIPFADVDLDAYYGNAVIWAKQNGIVNGVDENNFAPNAIITREQVAAILYRYSIYKGMDAVNLSENLGFVDADEISEYAISAMNWAVGQNLIKGYEDNTVRPTNNITRAEMATVLQRFLTK